MEIFSFKKYILNFNNVIKTSRGEMTVRNVWFIFLKKDNIIGIGEVALLFNLSIETENEVINELEYLNYNYSPEHISMIPSIQFALETARLDLFNGGKRIIYTSDFINGFTGIPINGLIWMSDFETMKNEITNKIKLGFKCIKIKIGSLNFRDELKLIEFTRKLSDKIEIRLDANGAFHFNNVFEKLEQLSKYNIHSIEQPIKSGQIDNIKNICISSPIPIALDEELIHSNNKIETLNYIKPQFVVLKPSLIGGIKICNNIIDFCENNNIKWWVTSSLESSIGLNYISQWVSTFNSKLFQGLGTGSIYKNNFISPLSVINDKLHFSPNNKWDYRNLLDENINN